MRTSLPETQERAARAARKTRRQPQVARNMVFEKTGRHLVDAEAVDQMLLEYNDDPCWC